MKGGPIPPTNKISRKAWTTNDCDALYVNDVPLADHPSPFFEPTLASLDVDWAIGTRMRDRFIGQCFEAILRQNITTVDCEYKHVNEDEQSRGSPIHDHQHRL